MHTYTLHMYVHTCQRAALVVFPWECHFAFLVWFGLRQGLFLVWNSLVGWVGWQAGGIPVFPNTGAANTHPSPSSPLPWVLELNSGPQVQSAHFTDRALSPAPQVSYVT